MIFIIIPQSSKASRINANDQLLDTGRPGHNTAVFGLFYAISPSYQCQGYASEATQALVNYAFQQLNIKRIIATTDYDNTGSMGVMRKLGMRIERNPLKEPPWLQVVGILDVEE